MRIFLGADHRGYALKEKIQRKLDENHEVVDLGNIVYDPNDDYVDFAMAVAKEVADDKESRGIVICGSGAGVEIVANKFDGIRSVLASTPAEIEAARRDDDVNVLALAADFTKEEDASNVIAAFLETDYIPNERHERRLDKIAGIEHEN